jgi:hypothetical protein
MIPGIPKEAFIFLAIIGLVLIGPLIVDQFIQYRFARKKLDKIDLSKENKKNYEISKPTPTPGLYRSLMTFGVILLIASMLMYVLGILSTYMQPLNETLNSFKDYMKITNQTTNNNQTAIINNLIVSHADSMNAMSTTMLGIIKDVATILGGAVSAIVGFYFGNKAATDSVPEKPTPPEEKTDTGKTDTGKSITTKDQIESIDD